MVTKYQKFGDGYKAEYYSRCFTLGVRVRLLREGRGCG